MNRTTEEILLSIMKEEANIDAEINQELYPKPEWAVNQIVRASGLVEDICQHHVGHPNISWLRLHDPDGEKGFGIHGCCQGLCCFDDETKAKIRNRDRKEV